ncbi:MAG: hypothetical protein GY834_00525 [Bacteroidetes bacterium]|nr:hypothetical protein [Bacteroidota bacterium]
MTPVLFNRLKIIVLTVFFVIAFLTQGWSQSESFKPPKTKEPHSAHKATIYSLILPGLGQAYNKKYWKIPVIYAGFGILGYLISANSEEYKAYKTAYEFVSVDENDISPNEYYDIYSKEQLKQGRDYYRRNMELSYILTGFLYILNLVDASVDAHLLDFDVSPELSLRVEPYIINQPTYNQNIPGLRIRVGIPGIFGLN